MKAKSKQTNHFISVMCLIVFILAIVNGLLLGAVYLKKSAENKKLEEQYNQMKEEYAAIQEMYENTDEDGYYNAYSDGEMVIYGVGGTIIIES